MKNLVFIILLGITSLSFADGQTIEIDIKGMTCPFCQDGLDRNLSKLPGVENTEVSLKLKKARITLKPGQTLDDQTLRDTVIDAGFTPGDIHHIK